MLPKNMYTENPVDYKRKKAVAHGVIDENTKKRTWREFCSSIGREVKIQEIWGLFKKMSGKRKLVKIPALSSGQKLAG